MPSRLPKSAQPRSAACGSAVAVTRRSACAAALRMAGGAAGGIGAALLAGCAVAGNQPPSQRAATAVAPGEPVQVAAGVYMLQGTAGEAEPGNSGRVGNAGFVVGPQGVVVVDSGTSYRQGQALLQAVARVTPQPVRLLLLTHTRQEFLFGAAAFRARGIPVHMHIRAAQLMAGRCETCLKTLRRVLGETEMQHTEVVKPDQVFENTHTLAPTLIGRPLRLLYFGHSSGPGDVALLDETTGSLFAGGLLDHQRIPDVQDADLPGWQRALLALGRQPLQHIIPGHGPQAGPELPATVGRYLQQLQDRARSLLRQGAPLSEVPDALELAEFKHWDQYDTIHRRNAAVVFLRLEQQQLLQ